MLEGESEHIHKEEKQMRRRILHHDSVTHCAPENCSVGLSLHQHWKNIVLVNGPEVEWHMGSGFGNYMYLLLQTFCVRDHTPAVGISCYH